MAKKKPPVVKIEPQQEPEQEPMQVTLDAVRLRESLSKAFAAGEMASRKVLGQMSESSERELAYAQEIDKIRLAFLEKTLAGLFE